MKEIRVSRVIQAEKQSPEEGTGSPGTGVQKRALGPLELFAESRRGHWIPWNCLQSPEEGTGSPGTGVTDGCKSPEEGTGSPGTGVTDGCKSPEEGTGSPGTGVTDGCKLL
ncbi:hypothetical protein STEG23_006525, partial [Scotinomys teguina]